jgi:hypothetical protein
MRETLPIEPRVRLSGRYAEALPCHAMTAQGLVLSQQARGLHANRRHRAIPQAVPKANKTNQSRQGLAELFSPAVAFQ